MFFFLYNRRVCFCTYVCSNASKFSAVARVFGLLGVTQTPGRVLACLAGAAVGHASMRVEWSGNEWSMCGHLVSWCRRRWYASLTPSCQHRPLPPSLSLSLGGDSVAIGI